MSTIHQTQHDPADPNPAEHITNPTQFFPLTRLPWHHQVLWTKFSPAGSGGTKEDASRRVDGRREHEEERANSRLASKVPLLSLFFCAAEEGPVAAGAIAPAAASASAGEADSPANGDAAETKDGAGVAAAAAAVAPYANIIAVLQVKNCVFVIVGGRGAVEWGWVGREGAPGGVTGWGTAEILPQPLVAPAPAAVAAPAAAAAAAAAAAVVGCGGGIGVRLALVRIR